MKGDNKMCKYCGLDSENAIMENESFFAIYAKEPVITGHILIVSKEHTDYFSLSYRNNEDLFMMVRNCRKYLEKRLSPDSYNIGLNVGAWAGQKEGHTVMHIIPRFAGDVPPEEVKRGILKAFK